MILSLALGLGVIYFIYYIFESFNSNKYTFEYTENKNNIVNYNILKLNNIKAIKDMSLLKALKLKRQTYNIKGNISIKCNTFNDNR